MNDIQAKALEFINSNPFCIINLGTGLGKTKIAVEFVKQNKYDRSVILVPKTTLLQWQEYFVGVEKLKNGFYCRNNYGKLVFVISQHSIHKYPNEIKNASCIIIDEPKLLKSNTRFKQQLMAFETAYQKKILLDATILENNFNEIDSICEWFNISRYDLPKYIFTAVIKPVRKINKKIVEIPLTSQQKNYEKFYEDQILDIVERPSYNLNYLYAKIRELLDYLSSLNFKNDPGWNKLYFLCRLLEQKHGKERGILFTRSKHSMSEIKLFLGRFLPVVSFDGSTSASERKKIRDEFNMGKIKWIVATNAAERGLDLYSGSVVVHFDLPWSQSSWRQRDRVTRLNSDPNINTTIYSLIIKNSVEVLQRRIIAAKEMMDNNIKNGHFKNVPRQTWKSFLLNKRGG